MAQAISRRFLAVGTTEHQHSLLGKAMVLASLQLGRTSARMRQIPGTRPRVGGWTRQLPEIHSSSMISWHPTAGNVCSQYYSPNSANLWVGACHATAQVHFWNDSAVTSCFWLCWSASHLLGVCECKGDQNSHPKVSLLYFNIAFRENILQRTQTRWTVSTEVLYPWYTVEAFILVWWRLQNVWKTGTEPLRPIYF